MAQHTTQVEDRLITDKEVAHLLGASRSWPWKLAQDGRLPAPIRLTERCTRWRLSEIRAWMADPQGWQAANAQRMPRLRVTKRRAVAFQEVVSHA